MNDVVISVIVPVGGKHGDLHAIHREFSAVFRKLGKPYEFIFVVDGGLDDTFESLKRLKSEEDGERLRLVKLSKSFGESTALLVGFEKARGEYIFTVASYFQADPEGVIKLWEELEKGYDLVVTRREPRIDSRLNRIQSRVFHWLVSKATSMRFHDINCGLKAMRRSVINEMNLYGSFHRFIPILAQTHGFRVKEVPVPQRKENARIRLFGLGRYLRYFLDILTVFFITRFTMMPLRFFGGIAAALVLAGGAITGYLGVYRILGYGGIANRPLLLLGVLLVAVGIQIFSLGLIGELIVFIHARQIKQYRIAEILE